MSDGQIKGRVRPVVLHEVKEVEDGDRYIMRYNDNYYYVRVMESPVGKSIISAEFGPMLIDQLLYPPAFFGPISIDGGGE